MKCRFWSGLEGYIWISWVYLERFVRLFFPSSVLSREGDKQVTPTPIPSPPPPKNTKNQQDLCLELLLDMNAMNVLGERTFHVGEGF